MGKQEQEDYKKMYLEQKLTALQMELQLLQNRFGNVQRLLKDVQAEYDAIYSVDKKIPNK